MAWNFFGDAEARAAWATFRPFDENRGNRLLAGAGQRKMPIWACLDSPGPLTDAAHHRTFMPPRRVTLPFHVGILPAEIGLDAFGPVPEKRCW